ncbi:unnamed protein product, partial [Nesidiocoris tenuis]
MEALVGSRDPSTVTLLDSMLYPEGVLDKSRAGNTNEPRTNTKKAPRSPICFATSKRKGGGNPAGNPHQRLTSGIGRHRTTSALSMFQPQTRL